MIGSFFILDFCRRYICLDAGGHSISLGLCPTKLPVKWDIRLGQLDVPAPFSIFVNGNRLSQVPARRFSNSFQTQTTVRFSQSD